MGRGWEKYNKQDEELGDIIKRSKRKRPTIEIEVHLNRAHKSYSLIEMERGKQLID